MDIQAGWDASSGVTSVALSGVLDAIGADGVRQALMKCAAECPAAVIVNLKDVQLRRDAQAVVFATSAEHALREFGVPVLYVEAGPELAVQLAAFRTFVHVFSTQPAALQGLAAWTPRSFCETMPPVADSVAAARAMVGQACLQWDLPSLREPAQLITSELVTNAIMYTGQPFWVTVGRGALYLRVSVRDVSTTLPDPPDGFGSNPPLLPDTPKGLQIVQLYATRWASTPMSDGKVVWAALRI